VLEPEVSEPNPKSLVLIGYPAEVHVGHHLWESARALGLSVCLADSAEAYQATWLVRAVNWHLRQPTPAKLQAFSRQVVALCRGQGPAWLLATGLAPLTAETLDEVRGQGTACLNYLTDDPGNPRHRTPWFLRALPHYDRVFSPRQSNLAELRTAGCPTVAYLPFAYHPELHRPEEPDGEEERRRLASDVLLVGWADPDRVPVITQLIRAGLEVALYGGHCGAARPPRPSAARACPPARRLPQGMARGSGAPAILMTSECCTAAWRP
jgi:hypothetical protein